MANDSDCTPLEHQPRVRVPRPWRRRVETVAVLVSLIGGGFGLGYVYASRVAGAEVERIRSDHQQEIARLQEAWSGRLSALAGRVDDATGTAQAAAQVASEAAGTAQAAATTAAKAAKDVKK